MAKAERIPELQQRARSLPPATPADFELVDSEGAVLARGSELRCQAAVLDHFGRDHWFSEGGTVLRGGEDGEPPTTIATIRPVERAPKPVLCALCRRAIEPPEAGLPVEEELLVEHETLTSTTSSGLYHPGECHSQAVVIAVLDRVNKEANDATQS